MSNVFDDESLGLELMGYSLAPNSMLETKIAIYTPEIVESILLAHPDIVDRWLQKLHREYIGKKKSCDFDNDPVACFTLSAYEEFEKHFKSWQDGGIMAITIPHGRVIRITKNPLVSIMTESNASYLVCSNCKVSFTDIKEFEKHRRQESGPEIAKLKVNESGYDKTVPNPIWWFAT